MLSVSFLNSTHLDFKPKIMVSCEEQKEPISFGLKKGQDKGQKVAESPLVFVFFFLLGKLKQRPLYCNFIELSWLAFLQLDLGPSCLVQLPEVFQQTYV